MDSESTKNDAPNISPTSDQGPSECNVDTSVENTESSKSNIDTSIKNSDSSENNVTASADNPETTDNVIVENPQESESDKTSTVEDVPDNQSITEKIELPNEIQCSSDDNNQNDTEASEVDVTKQQSETEISNLEMIDPQGEIVSSIDPDVSTSEQHATETPPVTTEDHTVTIVSESNEPIVSPNPVPETNESSLDISVKSTNLNLENISDSGVLELNNLLSDTDELSIRKSSSLENEDNEIFNANEVEPALVCESATDIPTEENVNRESPEKEVIDSTGNEESRLCLKSPEKEQTKSTENNESVSCSKSPEEEELDSMKIDESKSSLGENSEVPSNCSEVGEKSTICSNEMNTPVFDEQASTSQNEPVDAMEVDKDNVMEIDGENSHSKQTVDNTEVEALSDCTSTESITPDVQLPITNNADQEQAQRFDDKDKIENDLIEKNASIEISSGQENISKSTDLMEDKSDVSETPVSKELQTNANDCQKLTSSDIDKPPSPTCQVSENISQNDTISTNLEEISPDLKKDVDNEKIIDAEVPIKNELGNAENLKDNSAISNDTGVKDHNAKETNDTEGSKNRDMIEPMVVDETELSSKESTESESVDSKDKDSIEESAKANTSENIVSENSFDVVATEEALSKKNKGKDDENVIEKNIEKSGENKDGDLINPPDNSEKINVENLSNTNKNDDSNFSLAIDNLNSVLQKSELESKVTFNENSKNSATDLTEEEDMHRRSKSKESNIDVSTKIDDTVIYEKFDCKPLTVRADINIEELQKLKSVPEILGETLVAKPQEKEQLKKSNDGDEQKKNNTEPAKTTRSTAKTQDSASESRTTRPKKIVGPKRAKEKQDASNNIKDKEEVSKKEELLKKTKEKSKNEFQKKSTEKAVEKPVEGDKPKIKCKKMDIQETKKDVREPSKRLIIKTQSSINESVQPEKKSTPLVQAGNFKIVH